jgi:hypothetical protein
MRFSSFIVLAVPLVLDVVAATVTCVPYPGTNFSNPILLAQDGPPVVTAISRYVKWTEDKSEYKAFVLFDENFDVDNTHTTTLRNKGVPGAKPLSIHFEKAGEVLKYWLASKDSCVMDTPKFSDSSYADSAKTITVYVNSS